jgi:DNA-directed RNA polymerase specialized sigma24 family protein
MDEGAIIERCLKGDREAFRFLVERYQKQAVGHALALLGNREDARDAAQEAFIDAFRALVGSIRRGVFTRGFTFCCAIAVTS